MDWIVLIAASAAFGGIWWLLSHLKAHMFVIAFFALLAALVVWQSRTLLGIPL